MMVPPNFKRILGKALKQPVYALKIGLGRMVSNIYYHLGRGIAAYPESVTLFLTHKCNLHCKMCGQWGEGGVTKKRSTEFIKEELPLELLKAAIDDISFSSSSVTLFGGEPLLYKGCIELIKHIKSKKMHCIVITNGFLVEGLAESLVDSGLDELNLSLDGPGDLHDQIRGMPGLFEKIMAGLERIKSIKHQRDKKKPLVNIQCTITKDNYHRLEEMMAVAEHAGADSVTFHNLIFTNKDILARQKKFDDMLGCSSADWEGFEFDPGIDPAVLYRKIEEIRKGRYNFNIDFYPNFSKAVLESYYKDSDFKPSEYPARCLSPWLVAYIFPDGEVRPCLNSTYSYGNVKTGTFNGIWNSQKAIKYRRILKENKIFPACVRCTELYRY